MLCFIAKSQFQRKLVPIHDYALFPSWCLFGVKKEQRTIHGMESVQMIEAASYYVAIGDPIAPDAVINRSVKVDKSVKKVMDKKNKSPTRKENENKSPVVKLKETIKSPIEKASPNKSPTEKQIPNKSPIDKRHANKSHTEKGHHHSKFRDIFGSHHHKRTNLVEYCYLLT